MANEHDTLKYRLEALGRSLAVRRAQLKRGGISETRWHQAVIKRRVDAALERGFCWDLLKAEFKRDFGGVFAALLSWRERLDADTAIDMKKDGARGAPTS